MKQTKMTARCTTVPAVMRNQDGDSKSSIGFSSYALSAWLEELNRREGLYILDLEEVKKNSYRILYKDHGIGELVDLEFKGRKGVGDPLELIESLTIDLNLYEGQPILVFDRKKTERILKGFLDMYVEYADDLENIISRLTETDMLEIFKDKIFRDSRLKELNLIHIHNVLYLGGTPMIPEISNAKRIYQVWRAIENIYYQVAGSRMAA